MERIVINQNVKLREGGRKARKISIDDFKSAILKYLGESGPFYDDTVDLFCRLLENPKSKFFKDLEKIDADFENMGSPAEFIDGELDLQYQDGIVCRTSTGIPFVPLAFGGDWEKPIVGFLYWDGSDIRGYIPTYGNCFNRNTKQAFGNEEEEDIRFLWSEGLKMSRSDLESLVWWDYLEYDYPKCLEDFEHRVEAI